jgi:hypothetical protein
MTADPPENDYESALAGWFTQPKPVAAEAEDDGLLGLKKSAADPDALLRVRDWVRKRFKLPEDAAILVSEVECRLPGCPPLETVVAFWTKDPVEGEKRYHFKLFKKVADVGYDDLPFAWLLDTLVVPEGFACECC